MSDQPPLNLRHGSSPALSRARRRSLAVILVVALLGRLLVLLNVALTRPHNWLFAHPYEMGLLAGSLLHGHGFSSPFGVPTGPTALIAPGYPTLIAAVFFLFGIDTFASEIAIIALQILVALVTIWLMMRICRQQLDDRTAILAGAFWAVSLPILWVPAIFWETSLSACALPAIILLALRCRRRPTIASLLLLGASSAIVALINPALLPSLLAILAWAAWQTRRVARAAPLLGLLALLLLFSVWPIRNACRFHAFVPLRSTAGFELWMGNRPGATGFLDESLFPMYNKSELASYVAKGEVAYMRDKSDPGLAVHPRPPRNLPPSHPPPHLPLLGRDRQCRSARPSMSSTLSSPPCSGSPAFSSSTATGCAPSPSSWPCLCSSSRFPTTSPTPSSATASTSTPSSPFLPPTPSPNSSPNSPPAGRARIPEVVILAQIQKQLSS